MTDPSHHGGTGDPPSDTATPDHYRWREVAPVAALVFHPGHVVQFDDIKRRVAVFPLPGETAGFAAMDDICPHAGASLGDGWLDGDNVVCPLHGWEFDLRTGTCPYGPAWNAESFPVRITAQGVLQVLVGRRGTA